MVGIDYPKLLPGTSKILMTYYENDLINEDVVMRWGNKPSKKYVDKETSKKIRKAAAPFLAWLEEASEGDTEGEEEHESNDDEKE